jgi:hypothetical protein
MENRKSFYNSTTRESDVKDLINFILDLADAKEGYDKITITKADINLLVDLAKSIDEKSANGIWITKTN